MIGNRHIFHKRKPFLRKCGFARSSSLTSYCISVHFSKVLNFLSGFTEKEREFSQNAIQRQQQNYIETLQPDIEEDDEDDTGHGK